MTTGTPEAGKRAGARRAEKAQRSFGRATVPLAAGLTACVVAWGYLVYMAIDFGVSARGGESSAWGLLALATVGAIACLFAGLMLGVRLMRTLGLAADPAVARPTGGRRAAR
ncbi:hypothetical protein DDE18_20740 [Nocardioides gansuensis]|uniref:Uncharacterized protein n=1 Tax=Nocardioides gansuensis TaxID=2138300 RepID=A0A2T8F5K0_9ACTN|nr:hypothetical protein [Nocardioides gansuensis]PVG80987.1 hypothetical protein DDE18_20740 [Nocardioides gansuensis]